MSKTIAALTALKLSIDGLVSLDEDVSRYLKRWRLPSMPPGSSKPVTLRRLFGMTAGCNVPGYSAMPPARRCRTMCRSCRARRRPIRRGRDRGALRARRVSIPAAATRASTDREGSRRASFQHQLARSGSRRRNRHAPRPERARSRPPSNWPAPSPAGSAHRPAAPRRRHSRNSRAHCKPAVIAEQPPQCTGFDEPGGMEGRRHRFR